MPISAVAGVRFNIHCIRPTRSVALANLTVAAAQSSVPQRVLLAVRPYGQERDADP